MVAPIASTEGALAALFSVALLGERLSPGVAAGPGGGRRRRGAWSPSTRSLADLHLRPSLYAIAAAALFGFGLVASSQAGEAIGPCWTILVARVVGVVFVVAAAGAVAGSCRCPGAGAAAGGVLGRSPR